jgi:hypothetical protein
MYGAKYNEKPEWQIYLHRNKNEELYLWGLKKPSGFYDEIETEADPYKIFPGLPITTEKDIADLQAYYKNEYNRRLYESMLESEIKEEKKWESSSWLWKLITKRPDSKRIKDRISAIPKGNIKIKEARYKATVEECEPPNNNLFLIGTYDKIAGVPPMIYWTVLLELSKNEKQILLELQKTEAKTGLKIYADDAPSRKRFFGFSQPYDDTDDDEYNRNKKMIAGIFPQLPKITNTNNPIYKTYKMSIEKVDIQCTEEEGKYDWKQTYKEVKAELGLSRKDVDPDERLRKWQDQVFKAKKT